MKIVHLFGHNTGDQMRHLTPNIYYNWGGMTHPTRNQSKTRNYKRTVLLSDMFLFCSIVYVPDNVAFDRVCTVQLVISIIMPRLVHFSIFA